MQGKHVVITGPTAGIGRSSALSLAADGADLTLLCRNADKAMALCQDIVAAGGSEPRVVLMDMAQLDSVRAAAEEVLALGRPIDVLLNNAGIVNTQRKETIDGFECMARTAFDGLQPDRKVRVTVQSVRTDENGQRYRGVAIKTSP